MMLRAIMSPPTQEPESADVEVRGDVAPEFRHILSTSALHFIARLAARFEDRRQELLATRRLRQQELDRGTFPDFLEETREIRDSKWTVAPIPADLRNRRVEITGPVDRKMIINAL